MIKISFFKSLMLSLACVLMATGCNNEYSPNTYSSGGMQQVNKVDHAVVKSVRQVSVKEAGLNAGTAVGGITGGVGGAQIGQGKGAALAAIGGALAGAAIGTIAQQSAMETKAFEYILDRGKGDLITLAQKQDQPFEIGAHVLILYGVQARIIADTVNK